MSLNGYTNIPDWMLSLGLDIYETIILAVIYGFSQDGESTFKGSQRYLANKALCSRQKVTKALPELVNRGLIEKIDVEVRGVKLCEYKVTTKVTCCNGELQGGCNAELHNNIDKENIDINTLSIKGKSKFQKPSIADIRQYCQERHNSVDADMFYNFYESKGWVVGKSPMKDWKAAVRTWEQRPDTTKSAYQPRPQKKESVFEHNLKVMDQMYGTNLHEQAYGRKEVYDEQ